MHPLQSPVYNKKITRHIKKETKKCGQIVNDTRCYKDFNVAIIYL